MDTNEQMYGVAELTPTSKGLQPRTGHLVHPTASNHKQEKLKKKQKVDIVKVESGKVERSIPEDEGGVMARKKKASVRPYQAMSSARNSSTNDQRPSLLVKQDITPGTLYDDTGSLHTSGHTARVHSSNPHSTNARPVGAVHQSAAEQVPSNAAVASSKSKKKLKKQKKRGVGEIESELEPAVSSKPLTETPPAAIKPRPEALSIPETAGTPVQSDAPDTGDVRHMLHELLHPPPVSLVTPIPTPNTVKPFVFPTQPCVS